MPTAKRARAPETSANDDTAGNNNNNARKSSDNIAAQQQQQQQQQPKSAKYSQYSLNAAAAMGTAITLDELPMDTITPAHNAVVPTHQQHYHPAAAPPEAPYIQPVQGHDQVIAARQLHDQRRIQQQPQPQPQQQPRYYSQYAMNAAAAMGVGTTIPQLPPPINNNNATQHKANDNDAQKQQQQLQNANKQQWNDNNEYLRELNEDIDEDAKKFATWINEAKKPPADNNTNTNTNNNNKKPLPPLVLGLGNKMVAKKKKRRSSGPMPEKKVPGKWMTNYVSLI